MFAQSMFKIAAALFYVLFNIIFSLASASTVADTNIHSNPIAGSTGAGQKSVTIGIIIPMEHAALREIVAGFKDAIRKDYPQPVTFNVQNAQGDIKLQRNIIELFVGQKVDMIVPIGTTTTQMTLSLVKKQPIVSLAALYLESDRQKRNPRNITGINDEFGPKKKLDLIKSAIPGIKKMTVIFHTANEKNFAEIEGLESDAKKSGITVQTLAIQTLPELKTAAEAIEKDSQAILILKDHLVVSGIRLLIPVAEERHIPLVSADEGSVGEGAAFALGVRERAIGEEGGKLAAKILQGQRIENMPMQDVQELTVFYNRAACERQHADIARLKAFANTNHYGFVATPQTH